MAVDPMNRFVGVEHVIQDSLKFRLKLGIGEDAYTSLRVGKALARVWDVGGVAATGAGIAASPVVAGTFFGATGWLASLGLGAAAVAPVGWIVGAAVMSGGAYYGVTRAMGAYARSRVEVIPVFLNAPIDQLGAALLDMMAALSFKVAQMDGHVADAERQAMADCFVAEWGFDPAYVRPALELIEAGGTAQPIKSMTEAIARFVEDHPDCNFEAFRKEITHLLQEVAEADGKLDEREELAIAAICAAMRPKGFGGKTAELAQGALGGIQGAAGLAASALPAPGSGLEAVKGSLARLLQHASNALKGASFGRKR